MYNEDNKKDVKVVPNSTSKDVEVQGYAYCDSSQTKCFSDCYNNTTPFLSNIN